LVQVSYLRCASQNKLTAAGHHVGSAAEVDALQLDTHADARSCTALDRLEVLHVCRVNLRRERKEVDMMS
jgi:hypothetical protein